MLALCTFNTAFAGSSPAQGLSPTPASSANPVVTPTATAITTSLPVAAPHDAPAVHATTPPLAPSSLPRAPSPPDSLWFGDSATISLPITMHGERPFLQALIDGHPATLIIDTGAPATLIDAGEVDESSAAPAIALQIGDLRFPHLAAQRASVREYAETYLGAPADVVIGQDLLQRYPVSFDFPNHTLTIYRDTHTAVASQPPGATTVTLKVIDGRPALQGSLDGQPPEYFSVATGASYETMLENSTVASRYVRASRSIPFHAITPTSETAGVLVRARTLSIGALVFNQPLVAIFSPSHGSQAATTSGGLGMMMLSRLSMLIDETSGTASIVAPAGATSARLYDPSGITLAMRGGSIVVHSVVPGTPADTAHLRPGDEIVSINGLAPATLDFARSLLQGNPGTKVVVAYRRWHVTHTVTLPLHVII